MSAAPPLRRTVVLVGLMGAGKSSIGRRLAARFGVKFIDADAEIEIAAGCTIPEIFARHGEAAFRDGERRVIARLLDAPPHVLATGGGAFLDPATRATIAERAVSVWLRADLDVLVARCARRKTRPLLEQGDPRRILADLMAERYPVYAAADIVVDSVDGPHDAVVDQIVAALASHARDAPSASGAGR
ncbi:MAG: shikimate kinase [Alphaproteobacteria bacterium]